MSFAKNILKDLEDKFLYRSLKDSVVSGAYVEMNGKYYLNFASNDYMGVSANVNLQKDFLETLLAKKDYVMSSTASRLLAGNNVAYSSFENNVVSAYKKNKESDIECLVFNSGYHANTGILPSLTTSRDLIVADKNVHASIIDSLKLSQAKWLRFKHNDCENLIDILEKNRNNFENVFIVTEALFSMDADVADIKRLVEIKNKYKSYLYVDEAHSFGVYGDNSLGIVDSLNLIDSVDFVMATMGKALSSEGAFLLCKKEFKDLIINKCRSFIFTTAIAPINILWSKFIFNKISSMKKERENLKFLSNKIKREIKNVSGDNHILAIEIGDSDKALKIQKKLLDKNIYAPAIRYPTVSKNRAMLRLSLSAAMTESDIEKFISAYKESI